MSSQLKKAGLASTLRCSVSHPGIGDDWVDMSCISVPPTGSYLLYSYVRRKHQSTSYMLVEARNRLEIWISLTDGYDNLIISIIDDHTTQTVDM